MKNPFEINLKNIQIIIRKKEKSDFFYKCDGRSWDGFIFVTNGSGSFEYNGQKSKISAGSLLVLERGDKYFISASDADFEYITTAFDLIPAGAFSAAGIPHIGSSEQYGYLAKQFDKLLKIWEERSQLYYLKTAIQLEQIIVELLEARCLNISEQDLEDRLLPAISYIERFYDRELRSEELSELCHLSVSHFRRIFKEKTGVTPMQYRESIRINWAKRYLLSDLFSLAEIADKLGYYDIYHFSKAFKKYTGMSPAKYKNIKLKKD